MKHSWREEELIEYFTLSSSELKYLENKTPAGRIGFSILIKFMQYEGRFPSFLNEIPKSVINFIANQLVLSPNEIHKYNWKGSEAKQQRTKIRELYGFKKWSGEYIKDLKVWLQENLSQQFKPDHLKEATLQHLKELKIEPPGKITLERIINSAANTWEQTVFENLAINLAPKSKIEIDLILQNNSIDKENNIAEGDSFLFRQLKADPGNLSLQTILDESAKLECIRKVNLSPELFKGLSFKLLKKYRDRVITEPAREIRRHPPKIRYALFAIFLFMRGREITDNLIELLILLVHNIETSAEKKIKNEIIDQILTVNNKEEILYNIACVSLEKRRDFVEDAIFPVFGGEQTIHDLIREYKRKGPGYKLKVNSQMRSSYRSHYRRMLPAILKTIEFQSNNQEYRPIIDAIQILKKYLGSRIQFFPIEEEIPVEGVVPAAWKDLVFENNGKDKKRINRIAYEICVFESLREKLRCKEIWVIGADCFRNPDDDLPGDFDSKRAQYYKELNLPENVEYFISRLQRAMDSALSSFNNGYPQNPYVEIIKKKNKTRIKLSKLEAQVEPKNLMRLKATIKKQWNIVNLLDILKEADLRINFTKHFESLAQREIIDWPTLQKRLLLDLYAMGSNAGIKRIVAGNHGEKYHDLMYVKRRFITKEHLHQAIASVVNAIFDARLPHIWGETTTACASDSKKFGAWDQNLLTEWHARYGGRGVMIYWHVEKGASCIYSQLKRCSSSEVAAMIEGVIRHCTEMEVKKQYVDTHGQSYVAFAFCHLLGFNLQPRFKSIHAKKLYRPFSGQPDDYKNLQAILTRPINWDLIRQQYDQMVKYATAIRLGTAETESILRRFTRDNLKHPTYQALLELGKAIHTIFLCDYLNSINLRREIQEGLNVIELWNGVNDFIFFGKGGDFASNRKLSQELSALSLHLLQNCLVYINTLMIQQILNDPEQMKYMTEEDLRGLTPLIFAHINPYGTFDLDMESRIPIISEYKEAA